MEIKDLDKYALKSIAITTYRDMVKPGIPMSDFGRCFEIDKQEYVAIWNYVNGIDD